MRFVGFREIAVKSIVADAVDIRRRTGLQHVKDLADDAEQNGGEYMNPPTVRADGYALIAGRDRVAGAMVKKRKKIWVHIAECTDDEAKALELAENIYRRPLDKAERAKAIAALVSLREQQHRAEDEARREAGEKVSERSQDAPIARARREVAKQAGVTTETVRSYEHRADKVAESFDDAPPEGVAVPHPRIELPAGFQAFGLGVTEAERGRIDNAVLWLADWEADVRHVLRGLSDMEKPGLHVAVSPAHRQLIRDRALALGHAIREAVPAGLCFYCKGQSGLVERCNGCGQVGVVGRNGGDNVPAELKRIDVVHVAINGEMVPLAAHAAGVKATTPKAAGKKGKAIRVDVVDEAGGVNELTVEPITDEEIPF